MLKKFFRNEEGQGLVEYALILVLVAIVVIAILLILGPAVGQVFSRITYALKAGSAAGTQVTTIEDFQVSGTPGLGCSVTVDVLRVKVTQDSQPVSGVAVTASISTPFTSFGPLSGTTNTSGIVQWSAFNIGNDMSGCGGTATANSNGVSKSDTY